VGRLAFANLQQSAAPNGDFWGIRLWNFFLVKKSKKIIYVEKNDYFCRVVSY